MKNSGIWLYLQKIAKMLPLVLGMLCLSYPVQAQMVDTFVFKNEADRVRAVSLARSLRCLQCQNQNLVESNATAAYNMRIEVYEMVNQGKSNEDIIRIMTERFGSFVNYDPPFNPQTWVLWGLPLGLFGLLLIAILWRTKRSRAE
ncbi:heme lyase NrfEFG subunit NrfF [Mannheimia sp. AT1]|uniref:Formate-dependent nitrite reductase complex subunit n=1 Tax=Mannheimia cairinae TaxID=3025936 RepID=A0ABT5MP30_9PAST|nr:heme lyase NrfEFG subunit NrfF [Mannheimia cairinae]MDD0823934.1 heme lyase NrfEFG subunit NrfF [Mannheimia cairinae]MDD0825250.1 heme lyase NrfEFG subunit NrfF [Mannheimia cairinae]